MNIFYIIGVVVVNNSSRWLFRTARLNEGDLPRPVLTFLKIVTISVAHDIAWPAKVALEG